MKTQAIEKNKEKIRGLELKLANWSDTTIAGLQRRTVIQSDIALIKQIIKQDSGRISRYKLIQEGF